VAPIVHGDGTEEIEVDAIHRIDWHVPGGSDRADLGPASFGEETGVTDALVQLSELMFGDTEIVQTIHVGQHGMILVTQAGVPELGQVGLLVMEGEKHIDRVGGIGLNQCEKGVGRHERILSGEAGEICS
jgi:hypothetical protein